MKLLVRASLIFNVIVLISIIFSSFSGRVRRFVYQVILNGENLVTVSYEDSYKNKQSIFKIMPKDTSAIYFVGNSIVAGIEWNELFNDIHIKNRGIGGDRTSGVLLRIDKIAINKPQKIFLLVGINDLLQKIDNLEIVNNYEKILEIIKKKSPNSKIYVQSIMPVNSENVKSVDIMNVNRELKVLCSDYNCNYIDLFTLFKNENNELNEEYSFDGVHINGKGYEIWKNKIRQYL